jgi:PII-like signaling protein
MVVSVIDRTEKIEQFLPLVQEMVVGGIVVRDPVRVVHHAPVNQSN